MYLRILLLRFQYNTGSWKNFLSHSFILIYTNKSADAF